jgi:predicted SnoaL-like aldol condensation-catalyzing enzyme
MTTQSERTVSLKAAATSFLRLAASGNARQAFATYVGPGFRHHNPFFSGDAETLMAAMDQNAAENPGKLLEVQRTIEEANLVAVHSRVRQKPGDVGAAVVHIFRFENALIVELWDVGQPVPEPSHNEHGMF